MDLVLQERVHNKTSFARRILCKYDEELLELKVQILVQLKERLAEEGAQELVRCTTQTEGVMPL